MVLYILYIYMFFRVIGEATLQDTCKLKVVTRMLNFGHVGWTVGLDDFSENEGWKIKRE